MRFPALILILAGGATSVLGSERQAVYCSHDKEFTAGCGDLPACGVRDQAGTKYEGHCGHVRSCHEGRGALQQTCGEIIADEIRVDVAKADVAVKLPRYADSFLNRDGSEPQEKAFEKAEGELSAAETEEGAAIDKLAMSYDAHFRTAEKLAYNLEDVEKSYPSDEPDPTAGNSGGTRPEGPRGNQTAAALIKNEARAEKERAAKKVAQAKTAMAKSAESVQAYKTALGGSGDPKQAAAAKGFLDGALNSNPNDVMARRLRALNNFRNGDCAGAASDAQALLDANPDDRKAVGIFNLCRGKAGAVSPTLLASAKSGFGGGPQADGASGIPAARTDSPAAPVNQSGADPAPLLAQAFSALGSRDFNAAIAAAGWALDVDRRSPAGWAIRAMANNGLRDYKQAISDAGEGLKLAPGDPRLLRLKAFAQNRVKDYAGGLETADLAIQADPTNADGYVHRAFALGGLGDRKGMLASLRMAANFDPRYQNILEEAVRLRNGADAIGLFGGEDRPAAAPLPPANEPRLRGRPSGTRLLAAAGAAGLVMVVVACLFIRRFSGDDEPEEEN